MRQEDLKKEAERWVRMQGGIEPDESVLESGEGRLTRGPGGQPERYMTQVAVWKVYAEISVHLDAETGESLRWFIPSRAGGADETVISKEEALEIASRAAAIPADAELAELSQRNRPGSHITSILWRHVVQGLVVEGDCIAMKINSRTGEVFSFTKVWNPVTLREDRISRRDAEEIARREAPRHIEAAASSVRAGEQKYIPIVTASPRRSVEIVKVWAVNVLSGDALTPDITVLSVDCMTGAIVKVDGSL